MSFSSTDLHEGEYWAVIVEPVIGHLWINYHVRLHDNYKEAKADLDRFEANECLRAGIYRAGPASRKVKFAYR